MEQDLHERTVRYIMLACSEDTNLVCCWQDFRRCHEDCKIRYAKVAHTDALCEAFRVYLFHLSPECRDVGLCNPRPMHEVQVHIIETKLEQSVSMKRLKENDNDIRSAESS